MIITALSAVGGAALSADVVCALAPDANAKAQASVAIASHDPLTRAIAVSIIAVKIEIAIIATPVKAVNRKDQREAPCFDHTIVQPWQHQQTRRVFIATSCFRMFREMFPKRFPSLRSNAAVPHASLWRFATCPRIAKIRDVELTALFVELRCSAAISVFSR
ncbi:hypothetical protein [Bradyrhizobium sp. BRP22]|uniref:hypothetical protein n=1 Tax=Bradyrhizobium sp. BRP22 TaxID=2793821 RepID=UPI001CD4FE65|nr:hypothetical protein [Bradyrhizobium sp. BRP22]